MAVKKTAGRKTTRQQPAARRTSREKGWTGKGKFHGIIHVVPPGGGAPIDDGTRVLVALRRLFFGDVPDPGKNQLSMAVAVETDKASGGTASGGLEFDLIKYVPDHHALNLTDLVLFSGEVHRYLTIRCNVDELDEGSIESTQLLLTEGLAAFRDLPPGPAQAALGGVAGFLGSLIAFNQDDQVLVMNHSLYTSRVNAPGIDRTLRAGLYRFRKLPAGAPESTPAQVELEVEVIPVAA